MSTIRNFLLCLTLFLCSISFGQVSLSISASNALVTGNEFDSGGSGWLGDVREVFSIQEQHIADSYSIGLDFKGEKSNLSLDVLFSMDKLNVSSYAAWYNGYQTGTKHWLEYASYSVNYGYLGVRVSKQYILTKKQRVDFSIGQIAQFQVKLFERESNHYDSSYHRGSFYNPWSQTNSVYEEWSANSNEFEGMKLSPLAVRVGATIQTRFYFDRIQLSLFVNGGLDLSIKVDSSTGTDLSNGLLHAFLEIGTKFSYQLKKDSSI